MIGETISHYRITEKLGEGGMGVVYRATDLKLDRNVALKVLSSHLESDTDARRRFLREAKAAAALDHSNICMVYEIDEVDDQAMLAMQLIEGPTVKEKTTERPLKLDEALDIAIQTARGLQAAHEKSIVHRDIKSANLMLTADGQVKIMDFGLARLADHTQITKTAGILGTPAYMSPEQAQGQTVDHRSDVFSFGVVLYEMATGRLPFQGDNDQSVIYAIINQEPEPPTALRTGLPTDLDRIILKALAKEPEDRYQHIDEMGADLSSLRRRHESAPSVTVSATRSSRSFSLAKVVALLAVGILAATILTWWMTRPPGEIPVQTAESILTRLTEDSGLTYQPALSPDGQFLAYASDRAGEDNLDIWLQQIGGGSPIPLTSDPADDHEPSFSPDGRTVVFRSERDGGGVYVVPTLGGDAELIARVGNRPRFSPDGNYIAFYRGLPPWQLYVAPASGGEATRIEPEIRQPTHPVWLPDGRLLFAGNPKGSGSEALDWWITSIDVGETIRTGVGDQLREAGLRSSQLHFLLVPAVWSERDSSVLFAARQGDSENIWRIRIDLDTGLAQGPPQRVTTGTGSHVQPAISTDGRLTFANVAMNADIWSLPLEANQGRVSGDLERLTSTAAQDNYPSVSVNGEELVYVNGWTEISGGAIWSKELPSGKERAVGRGSGPSISPDGTQVAYVGAGSDAGNLYIKPTRGGIAEKVAENITLPWGSSHDGRYLLCLRPRIIALLDLESREETELLTNPGAGLFQARFSPDDKWIAFVTRRGQEWVLYVAPFRGTASIPLDEWVRVTDGRVFPDKPRWSPDGNILYFTGQEHGVACIYAQRLDPATKRPVGDVLDVYHRHNARLSTRHAFSDIAVARNKLILPMGELTGNIWMIEPESEY